MRNLCILTVISLSAGLVINGCKRSDDSASADWKLLQGLWSGSAPGLGEFKMAISGGKFDLKELYSDLYYKGTFTLNETTKPKQIDFLIKDSSIAQNKRVTARAIYEIENDNFRFASYNPGDTARPSDFNEPGGFPIFDLTKQATQ